MSRLRPRAPSPALVVAFVALVVALGGTSYAAFSLPNGSVGTPQLKNKAVTNAKLGPLSVGTAKLRDGSVIGSKMNFSGVTVPNANNATNATNATRLTGVQIVRGPDVLLGPNGQGNQTVTCPTGMVAIGGNEVNDSVDPRVSLNEVRFVGSGGASNNGVLVYLNNGTPTATISWHGYAICMFGSVSGTSARAGSAGGK
jgi:hypothetical protein